MDPRPNPRPSDPLDANRLLRLTVFGVPWCEDTAITRARLAALNVPFVYVDLEEDPRADAHVRDRQIGDGVALLVLDRSGTPVRVGAGSEAGYLADPAGLADLVATLDARARTEG